MLISTKFLYTDTPSLSSFVEHVESFYTDSGDKFVWSGVLRMVIAEVVGKVDIWAGELLALLKG